MHHKKNLSVLLLCSVLLSSCAGIISMATQPTATSPIEQPILVPHRPYRVIQLCLDTPPEYTDKLFHQATNKISDWIEAAAFTVNHDGFVVYVGEITSSSFQISPLAPIQVPAIPADTPMPTPLPAYTPTLGQNPYDVANIQATRDAVNERTYADWQDQLQKNHAAVAATLARTKEATKKLRSLAPIYDDKGADVFGCLADASQHFQSTPSAEHYLIIAATFMNNTILNQTSAIQLAGAHVRGIYRPCTQAPMCAANDERWKHTLIEFGANQDVIFYDVQQSALLAPVF